MAREDDTELPARPPRQLVTERSSSVVRLLNAVILGLAANRPQRIAPLLTLYAVIAANLVSMTIIVTLSRGYGLFILEGQVVEFYLPVIVTITTVVVAYPVTAYCANLVRSLNLARLAYGNAVAEAEQANASRSRFLANTSHEIRTPLHGVLGMTEVLLRSELTPTQREQLEIVHDNSQALSDLLNDLLDLSKIDAGHLEIAPEPADLAAALSRLCTLWRIEAENKGVGLDLQLPPDLPDRLLIDLGRIRQCVNNLISNALKFTARGRVTVEVEVSAMPDGRLMIGIDVSDTGTGIPPEKLGQLFRPFVQVDDSASRRQRGTGLGLAISRQLALLMGGDLTAISAPGLGSRFTLTVPAARVATEAGAALSDEAPAIAADPPRGRTLLVVDDNSVNRLVAQHFLAAEGHRVIEAPDGRSALSILDVEPVELVLLDVHMPGLDGPETLSEIRRSGRPWANVPVIALTADAMSGDRERYLAMGMADYLAKPIKQAALLSAVRAALGDPANPQG